MRQLSFLLPEEDEPEISPAECPRSTATPVVSEAIGAYCPESPQGHAQETRSQDSPQEHHSQELSPEESSPQENGHPFPPGTLFSSPGGHFTYRVIGACCRLFDREELPWPCCRLQWRGKEPSWRRIGRRFVLDTASRRSPSYNVEILELGHYRETIVMTLYAVRLSPAIQTWWYKKGVSL